MKGAALSLGIKSSRSRRNVRYTGHRTQAGQEETVRILLHVRVEEKAEREQVAKVTGTNKDTSLAKAPKKRESEKIYPNDPCPCGSGKKYKQCCGRK